MAELGLSDVIARGLGATRRRVSNPLWDDTSVNPLKDLPREGARWFHSPTGWQRWSYLDEDWVRAEMPPPSAVSLGPVGSIFIQVDDGTWMEIETEDDPDA